MRSTLNHDTDRREEILSEALLPDAFGGIQKFRELSLEQLETLIDEAFADPNETQNDSPSIGEFFGFMRAHPNVTAHGYIVLPGREDYRLTIEGLTLREEHATPEERDAFIMFNRFADEFEIDGNLRSWWD